MKTLIKTALLLLTIIPFLSAAQVTDSSTLPAITVKTFQSRILGEKRSIFIQTPANMNPADKYPVLYLLDGASFISIAGGQVQYLSESYKIIPSMIVVGIKSTDRFKDLTPTHSVIGNDGKPDTSARSPFRTSGGGDNFLKFLKEELFPYIENNYPAAPYRILFGHSLGGLMAMHALTDQPDLFNAYIAISPSLQWDNEVMLKKAASLKENIRLNKYIFFSSADEGKDFTRMQLAMDSIFKKKQFSGLKTEYISYPGETHISSPVKGLYDGLRHVYPNWHLAYSSSAFRKILTGDSVIRHYDLLSKTYQYKVVPLHDELLQVARFLSNDPKKIQGALDLLLKYIPDYAGSAAFHEVTGDIYVKLNDQENAVSSYTKAQAITPSEKLIQKINSLKK